MASDNPRHPFPELLGFRLGGCDYSVQLLGARGSAFALPFVGYVCGYSFVILAGQLKDATIRKMVFMNRVNDFVLAAPNLKVEPRGRGASSPTRPNLYVFFDYSIISHFDREQ